MSEKPRARAKAAVFSNRISKQAEQRAPRSGSFSSPRARVEPIVDFVIAVHAFDAAIAAKTRVFGFANLVFVARVNVGVVEKHGGVDFGGQQRSIISPAQGAQHECKSNRPSGDGKRGRLYSAKEYPAFIGV